MVKNFTLAVRFARQISNHLQQMYLCASQRVSLSAFTCTHRETEMVTRPRRLSGEERGTTQNGGRLCLPASHTHARDRAAREC